MTLTLSFSLFLNLSLVPDFVHVLFPIPVPDLSMTLDPVPDPVQDPGIWKLLKVSR